MRAAIVHYWLVGMRGGEKVLEALCRIYPQADIYTHCVDRAALSPLLCEKNIRTTFIQRLPGSVRHYKLYLPLMPLALEQLDLRNYDLVISSESGPAKGVLTRADTPHLCYCHTPMRYLWDFYRDYLEEAGILTRFFMRPLFHYLRLWDTASALRPDRIVANSHTVARRAARWWGREARVIHPPVETERFAGLAERRADLPDDAPYLCFGQLVPYKRADLAVRACLASGRRLIVAGTGTELTRLRRLAGGSELITFAGRIADNDASELMGSCRALIFPGEEDFGITPVEAMAAGCPVIAYARGGALETVQDGVSGLFFAEQTPEALCAALDAFEQRETSFDPRRIAAHAARFGEARFRREFTAEVEDLLSAPTPPRRPRSVSSPY